MITWFFQAVVTMTTGCFPFKDSLAGHPLGITCYSLSSLYESTANVFERPKIPILPVVTKGLNQHALRSCGDRAGGDLFQQEQLVEQAQESIPASSLTRTAA